MKTTRVRVPCLKRGRDYFTTTPHALAEALMGESEAVEYHGVRVGRTILRRLVKDLDGPGDGWLLRITANGRLEVKTFWPKRPKKLPSCFFRIATGAWLKNGEYGEPERVSLLIPTKKED